MSYRPLQSKLVFDGKVFRVRIDEVEDPTGRSHRMDVVEHPGSVGIVPLDGEGQIWFVEQYRHPTGGRLLELPAGTLDGGEPPAACAARECREEIGMAPDKLTPLGGFYLAPGYVTEYMHVFLAEELTPAPLPPDIDEDIRVVRIALRRALEMLAAGEWHDAKTIACLMLTLSHLGMLKPLETQLR